METKRVSDSYKISSPSIIIDGNLTVTGSTTSVETVNSTIQDNVITLNKGEPGSSVTEGIAGIEVDRGTSDKTTFLFNEVDDSWELKIGSNFSILRAAAPLANNDVATKSYVDTNVGNVSPGAPLASIQFNNGAAFGGSPDLLWNGSDLLVHDIAIKLSAINVTATNGSLEIAANGTGKLYLRSVLRLENQASDPTSDAGSNVVYAKVPGNAGTGVYFTNASASDELVSRSKAILFGLIF
jgi:hypothetical protein